MHVHLTSERAHLVRAEVLLLRVVRAGNNRRRHVGQSNATPGMRLTQASATGAPAAVVHASFTPIAHMFL